MVDGDGDRRLEGSRSVRVGDGAVEWWWRCGELCVRCWRCGEVVFGVGVVGKLC